MQQKYFYTVLFLDDYYPERKYDETTAPEPERLEIPELKKFEITSETNTENVKWQDSNTLYVRHNLKMPLTLEMWNEDNKPIFYCPVLKEGIDSISVGQVVIESNRSITLHFNEDNPPPAEGQTYVLALKELPSFDATSKRLSKDGTYKNISKALDEIINVQPIGMAIVFRRRTIDELFDLIADFDESYWHSLAQGNDLKYLTRRSLYQKCQFTTKYTSELQDVIDLIDPSRYEIKFSWNETRNIPEMKDVPPHDERFRPGFPGFGPDFKGFRR